MADVLQFVPAAPAPVRGWHGMKLLEQNRYRQADWQVWAALDKQGYSARRVVVARGSPAWHADLQSGTWILSINGLDFESFDKTGAAAGTSIEVRASFPGLGIFNRNLVLIEQPKKKSPPAWTREKRVAPGRQVGKKEQLTYLEEATGHSIVRRHVWFLKKLLKHRGPKGFIMYQATIARTVGCSLSPVKLSTRCCAHFGFIRVVSGKRKHSYNLIEICWPANSRQA